MNQSTLKPMTPKELIARKLYCEVNITEEDFSNMIVGPEAEESLEDKVLLKLQEFRPTL